jgi:Uri superfamily endonuclease
MTSPTLLPHEGGLYVLLLSLPTDRRLSVGRLGAFDLAAGWYAYVGSAHGPGGLAGRLAHHLRPVDGDHAPHWHIDHLRAVAPLVALWWSRAPADDEHTVAHAVAHWPGALLPIPRFGASDCRCPAHLLAFATVASFNMHLPGGPWHLHAVAPR